MNRKTRAKISKDLVKYLLENHWDRLTCAEMIELLSISDTRFYQIKKEIEKES